MKEILFTLILLAATVAMIALIRLIIGIQKPRCPGPKAELRIIYDENSECLEYTLGRILDSSALENMDLKIIIVDTIDTCESARWLAELRHKLGAEFIIESGGYPYTKPQSGDK